VGESVTLKLEDLEMRLLLEGVCASAGYDFRNYLAPMLRRRVWQCVREEKLRTISGFQEKALHDPDCMGRFIQALSINVSALYRDPEYYLALKQEVLPRLGTYPFIRIWHAGCSTGEEVYSMAMLLREEGLYDRSRIYATDINEVVLARAKAGIFPLERMQEYTENYMRAGGKRSFSEYYTAKYGGALFDQSLTKNVVFSQHNLVTDRSFSEFNVILCRNVLIYFDKTLQSKVHSLFYDSLAMFGVLVLGSKETLRFMAHEECYEQMAPPEKIFRKVR
jgi:chemotaxis protein methyltransferase CheR